MDNPQLEQIANKARQQAITDYKETLKDFGLEMPPTKEEGHRKYWTRDRLETESKNTGQSTQDIVFKDVRRWESSMKAAGNLVVRLGEMLEDSGATKEQAAEIIRRVGAEKNGKEGSLVAALETITEGGHTERELINVTKNVSEADLKHRVEEQQSIDKAKNKDDTMVGKAPTSVGTPEEQHTAAAAASQPAPSGGMVGMEATPPATKANTIKEAIAKAAKVAITAGKASQKSPTGGMVGMEAATPPVNAQNAQPIEKPLEREYSAEIDQFKNDNKNIVAKLESTIAANEATHGRPPLTKEQMKERVDDKIQDAITEYKESTKDDSRYFTEGKELNKGLKNDALRNSIEKQIDTINDDTTKTKVEGFKQSQSVKEEVATVAVDAALKVGKPVAKQTAQAGDKLAETGKILANGASQVSNDLANGNVTKAVGDAGKTIAELGEKLGLEGLLKGLKLTESTPTGKMATSLLAGGKADVDEKAKNNDLAKPQGQGVGAA